MFWQVGHLSQKSPYCSGSSHTHWSHTHLPRPLHSKPSGDWQTDVEVEQLQLSPVHPSSHTHSPDTHTPRPERGKHKHRRKTRRWDIFMTSNPDSFSACVFLPPHSSSWWYGQEKSSTSQYFPYIIPSLLWLQTHFPHSHTPWPLQSMSDPCALQLLLGSVFESFKCPRSDLCSWSMQGDWLSSLQRPTGPQLQWHLEWILMTVDSL